MKLDHDYGAIWSGAARRLDEMARDAETTEQTFADALREGFFSQYTAYDDPQFVDGLIDWQCAMLAQTKPLAEEPAPFAESLALPAFLRCEREGRSVSADFLRNLAYLRYLREAGGLANAPRRILEIGSGYGAFARLLKLACPEACICLTDIPASLRFADHFLRRSFPEARIITLREGDVFDPSLLADGVCDFLLMPTDVAAQIVDQDFDLAVNMWSFGEMTDAYIDSWFDLIQVRNRFLALFTVNAFLHPVQPGLPHLLGVGNWLPRIDGGWRLLALNADLPVMRCPLIMDYPTGLMVYAERLSAAQRDAERQAAAQAFARVLLADWARLVVDGQTPNSITGETIARKTDYIGIYGLSRLSDGTFAALWNQVRCADDRLAIALLTVYCRLLNRSDPKARASREELAYARRLPESVLAAEYAPYQRAVQPVSQAGRVLAVQAAFDAAFAVRRSNPIATHALLCIILTHQPRHAEAWFQLGQLSDRARHKPRARLFYQLACDFYPGWAVYVAALKRLSGSKGAASGEADAAAAALSSAQGLIAAGRWDEVEAALVPLFAVEGHADRPAALRLLARAADGRGDVQLAQAYEALAGELQA